MPRPDQIGGTYTQTRTFVYDLTTGWLTSATNPENGTTTYNYDAFGRLNYKQDAKGQRQEYLYDANNRVTKMTPKDSGGTVVACDVVEYFYDLTQNSYGRLSAIQWGSKDLNPQNQPLCAKGLHREEYAYTAGGRPTNKTLKLTRKFADLSFAERTAQMSIDYEYQALNAKLLQKIYYPATHTQTGPNQPVNLLAGSVYQYTYDSMGRATGETRQDPNQAAVSLVDQVTYNTFGALTQMRQTLANKTETRAYDSFQRLTSMTTFDGTAITYNYSPTANDGKLEQGGRGFGFASSDSGGGWSLMYQAGYGTLGGVSGGNQAHHAMAFFYLGFQTKTGESIVAASGARELADALSRSTPRGFLDSQINRIIYNFDWDDFNLGVMAGAMGMTAAEHGFNRRNLETQLCK